MADAPTFTDEQLDELARLSFDFLCQRRVADFISVDQVIEAIDAGSEPARVQRFQERFVAPARARLLALAKKSALTAGVWLPDGVRDELATLLSEPMPLPKAWVDEAIASERVREEVKALLHDTLTGFIAKATAGLGEATPSAVGGAIGRLSKNFAAASKGLLGGLGDTLQKQLQERVRDFVDGSVAAIQRRIAEKLTSDDTSTRMGKQRRDAFLKSQAWTEAEIARWVEQLPNAQLDRMVPAIVRHNSARAALRDAVRAEVVATLDDLNKQTIGELLDELGLRSWAQRGTAQAGRPLLRDFTRGEAFASWWQKATGSPG